MIRKCSHRWLMLLLTPFFMDSFEALLSGLVSVPVLLLLMLLSRQMSSQAINVHKL